MLFLDEIHRFNKAQQDALLPAVEDGLLTLIGATTENPAFEVNGALLSRLRVYALQALFVRRRSRKVLARAAGAGEDAARALPRRRRPRDFLAARSEGDARTALNALELAGETARELGEERVGVEPVEERCSVARSSTTRAGTAATTTRRRGSRRRAALTRTRRCTTWR